jgi:hypothetical protein
MTKRDEEQNWNEMGWNLVLGLERIWLNCRYRRICGGLLNPYPVFESICH